MSRPTLNPGSIFAKIFPDRKQQEQELAEQIVRAIAEETEYNERRIICTLLEINFWGSRLPREVLEHKTNPTQSCGDLESGAREAVQWLEKHPCKNLNDISPVDRKLLRIAYSFKEAVKNGNVKRAYIAKEGLLWGLQEVREKLSKVEWRQILQEIEQGASDLEEWINLVELAGKADILQTNEEQRRKDYEASVRVCEQKFDALDKEIKSDIKKFNAFKKLAAFSKIEENSEICTEIEQEEAMLRQLRDLETQARECTEKKKILELTQKELDETNQEVEQLRTELLLKWRDDTSEWIQMGED